jgi:hypothetical protein
MSSSRMMLAKDIYKSPGEIFPKDALLVRMEPHIPPKPFRIVHVNRLKGHIEIPNYDQGKRWIIVLIDVGQEIL